MLNAGQGLFCDMDMSPLPSRLARSLLLIEDSKPDHTHWHEGNSTVTGQSRQDPRDLTWDLMGIQLFSPFIGVNRIPPGPQQVVATCTSFLSYFKLGSSSWGENSAGELHGSWQELWEQPWPWQTINLSLTMLHVAATAAQPMFDHLEKAVIKNPVWALPAVRSL
jgi:hypothetical protein